MLYMLISPCIYPNTIFSILFRNYINLLLSVSLVFIISYTMEEVNAMELDFTEI
jgi:hypothetical protein